MAQLVFDPKHGQEAADAILSVCNGQVTEPVVGLYGVVKTLGEGNPIVDTPVADLKKIEAYFNEQVVPAANAIKEHFLEHAELSAMVMNTESAKTAEGEDIGQVGDTTYDAAKNL